MKLKFRKSAKAEDLASVHRHLSEAWLAMNKISAVQSSLDMPSSERVRRLSEQIKCAAFSMESQFMQLAGKDAPFANVANPRAWGQWLEKTAGNSDAQRINI